MKNKIRVFLCLLFAVIFPFSFVACGKNSNNDNGTNSTIETPQEESSSSSTPEHEGEDVAEEEINYVLDKSEVVRVLGELTQTSDDFVSEVNNNSVVLSNGDYPASIGEKTASIFNYASYPESILEVLSYRLDLKSQSFELGEVYAYISGSGIWRFIEINVVDNDKIILEVVSWNLKQLNYYNFEINVDNGDICSLNVSKLVSVDSTVEGRKLEFANANLDFANLTLTAEFGNINGYNISSETFFNVYFTEEYFDEISSVYWGYSQYEKISLSESAQLDFSVEKGGEKFVSELNNFKFLNAFNKYYEYTSSEDNIIIQDDIFGTIDANSDNYSYNLDGYTFDKVV